MQNQLKLIKTLVLVLSALLVAGLGFTIYRSTLATAADKAKIHKIPAKLALTTQHTQIYPGGQKNFGTIDLAQPHGSTIAHAVTNGQTASISITGGGLSDRVVFVNLINGNVTGTVCLTECKKPDLQEKNSDSL